MKIFINDYAGHPFQLELSHELARRGHSVWHSYSADVEGAKADFCGDATHGLEILPISIGHTVRKYQFHKRLLDEREYGKLVAEKIRLLVPDIVVNANTPLDAYRIIRKAEISIGARRIYWLQDMIGYAATKLLKGKYFGLGSLIGKRFFNLETRLLRGADQIIVISEGFIPYLTKRGVPNKSIKVIHNWAPLEDLPIKERNNEWRREQIKNDKFTYLYSGTLGLKHNPQALIELGTFIDSKNIEAQIIVISEGIGADYIKTQIKSLELNSVTVLDYQPFSRLPEVLASADVLITLLEEDAGVFSVPSKILSYMCASRPQLAAMPKENLGALLISDNNCGFVCRPNDNSSFLKHALELYDQDSMSRAQLGKNARNFAELNFDISNITNKFESTF